MVQVTENTELRRQALAYVGELYRELSQENGAPTLGTQNQAVDFILTDAELSRAISAWARSHNTAEATTMPPQRLPMDALYQQVRGFLIRSMEPPVFVRDET
ncbi:MAG: hypothetical protein JO305_08400 [Alphaproteobacteria bacterium]|nr:hypothetical protein [Alphaproteobacteria bacterium]